MKHLFLIILLFLVMHSYSQAEKSALVKDVNTYGYINGQRLDSLSTSYAYFSINLSNRIRFDYGQQKTTNRSSIITNADGEPLSFEGNNVSVSVLNFFHYNHWELVSFDATSSNYIIRK